MPQLKKYDLFLSHSWKYDFDYNRLVSLLRAAPLFDWRNYSVPEHDPLIDPGTTVGKQKLTDLLEKQVRPVNCVIILSGMYAHHSSWIQKEIELAQYYSKPILGVRPWGQINVPVVVQNAAHEIVGWNTDSIVSAIRRISL